MRRDEYPSSVIKLLAEYQHYASWNIGFSHVSINFSDYDRLSPDNSVSEYPRGPSLSYVVRFIYEPTHTTTTHDQHSQINRAKVHTFDL